MSLKAIAKELGISVTTVSRALNGYDDVSQETRARVEAGSPAPRISTQHFRASPEDGQNRRRRPRFPRAPRAAE